ncbi:MAG: cytochrome c oxidase assembly protein [Chloroflexota bacterium]
MPRPVRRVVAPRAAVVAATLLLLLPVPVGAHGPDPGPPGPWLLTGGWSFDPLIWLPVLLAGLGYHLARRKVDREHPGNPVPRFRSWCWMAGLVTLLVAIQSPIERYDTVLFSVHMVQHLLLAMVAAPLLLLGAPVTLLLRAATPELRRRVLLPILHARILRVLTHPLVTWSLFAIVLWGSHFTPLFDAALEDRGAHLLEHALYLSTALLFWYPVIGADPGPNRLPHGARVGYLALGMPFGTFLGLAIFSSTTVLYPHYATLGRTWGPTPLEDQALAGGLMWAGGDGVFLLALVLAVAAWLRSEEREARRIDAQLDRERAAAASPPATPEPDTPA